MNHKYTIWAILWVGVALTLASCGKDPNDTGLEFAPNMYHSIPYEPLTQIDENKINEYGTNVRVPVKGTVARRNYKTSYTDPDGKVYDLGLMVYNTHRDSLEAASKDLQSPLPVNAEIIAEGKVLYERYCAPCHGKEGKGDGAVGKKYTGVANLSGAAYQGISRGHIFHVITHGKGRMWPHASQISPLDRWKIIEYVYVLQGRQDEGGVKAGGEEATEKTEETPSDSTQVN